MGVVQWFRLLWAGQVRVSNRITGSIVAAVAALWIWGWLGGLSAPHHPDLITALIWIYSVGLIMVASSCIGAVAGRVLFLNLQAERRNLTPAERRARRQAAAEAAKAARLQAAGQRRERKELEAARQRDAEQEQVRQRREAEQREAEPALAGRRSGRDAYLDGRHFRTGR